MKTFREHPQIAWPSWLGGYGFTDASYHHDAAARAELPLFCGGRWEAWFTEELPDDREDPAMDRCWLWYFAPEYSGSEPTAEVYSGELGGLARLLLELWSRGLFSGCINFTHRGVAFQVSPRSPCPGIGWFVPAWRAESGGAFYDQIEEHPEGALAWAEAACRKYIDWTLDNEVK